MPSILITAFYTTAKSTPQQNLHYSKIYTKVEFPNKEHFRTASFVLGKEAVLFGGFKTYWNYREK